MSEEHNWKFAQCFGDKGDSDDITDGKLCLDVGGWFAQKGGKRHWERCVDTFVWERRGKRMTPPPPPLDLVVNAHLCTFLSRHYLDRWIWSNWWLPCHRWQRRTRCFIREKRERNVHTPVCWLQHPLSVFYVEKELRVPFLYRIPIPWSRVWLPQEFGDWRKDQQDQMVQKTEFSPLFVVYQR